MFHALGHYRAYGVALLVGLFCSFSFADFQSHDSQALQQILYTLLGSGTTNGDSIWALTLQQKSILNSIDSKLSPVSTISSDVATIKQFLDYNLNGDTATDSMSVHDFIAEFNRKFFQGVDRYGSSVVANPATVSVFSGNGYSPFVEPGSSFNNSRTSQMAVTNVAETYWLEKIYDVLRIGCGAGLTVYSPYIYSRDNVNVYTQAIKQLMDGISEWENGQIDDATFFNRYGSWLDRVHDFASHIDYQLLNSDQVAVYLDVLQRFGPFMGPGPRRRFRAAYDGISSLYQSQYGTYLLTSNSIAQSAYTINNGGLSANIFTNLVTSEGSIENTNNAFTNSETSVFSKFATSFLPSGMFNPDEVNTNLFEYVDSDISETPSFNPIDISGNGGLRSSSSDFDYDFEDSTGDYDYNLINPLKTATDTVQHDTDLDNKFEQLAGLVNQRITSIFENPMNTISSQPARWQASLIDKDMNETEDYVDPQYSKSSDGVQFVCWCCESMMFFTFFSYCVRRSLNVQKTREVPSDI